MYALDKDKLEEILRFFEAKCAEAEEICLRADGELSGQQSLWLHLACERLLLLFRELFTDVAAMLLDRLILRDPGSYEDMVDILAEEGAIDSRSAAQWKELMQISRRLEKEYLSAAGGDSIRSLAGSLPFLRRFSQQIRAFVQKELP